MGKGRLAISLPHQLLFSGMYVRLCVLGVILCALLGVVYLWKNTVIFPIKQIRIAGDFTYVDKKSLKALVLPYVQNGLLRFDRDALKRQLLHNPWIETVDIKRVWPSVLTLSFHVRKPLARWGSESLIDASGYKFSSKADFSKLPIFQGTFGREKEMIAHFESMRRALSPLHLNIKVLRRNEQGVWSVYLDQGLWLHLGRADPLQRLKEFVSVYPQYLSDQITQIDYINLSYPNGMAVKFK